MTGIPVKITDEDRRRFEFDAKHNVEPTLTIAERIAGNYITGMHPVLRGIRMQLAEEISHAIEDARELGRKMGEAGIK
jgi:hypothetical protein